MQSHRIALPVFVVLACCAVMMDGAAAVATLVIENVGEGRLGVTVRATAADAGLVYRVFTLKLDPPDLLPITGASSACTIDAGGVLSCTFSVDKDFVHNSPFVVLMGRPLSAPEDRASYRRVAIGALKDAPASVTMSSNLDEVIYAQPRARLHVRGALIAEDFNSRTLNTQLWRIWQQDAGLSVEAREGQLVIAGRTGKAREIPATAPFRFTGLVSLRRFAETDGVLVAKLKIPDGVKSVRGQERYMIHYCGATPDYFSEVVFGREADGRLGWFFLSRGQHGRSPDESPLTRPTGGWDLVKVDYDSASQTARGWLWSPDSGSWQAVGSPHKLFLSSVQVELKVNIPQDGLEVEARFDDCRLYPKPESSPVRILVYRPPAPGYSVPGVAVQLYETDGVTLIGKGVTDANGVCRISLSSKLTYPIGAVIKLEHGGNNLGAASIHAAGVDGLYPGDLWVVNLARDSMK